MEIMNYDRCNGDCSPITTAVTLICVQVDGKTLIGERKLHSDSAGSTIQNSPRCRERQFLFATITDQFGWSSHRGSRFGLIRNMTKML